MGHGVGRGKKALVEQGDELVDVDFLRGTRSGEGAQQGGVVLTMVDELHREVVGCCHERGVHLECLAHHGDALRCVGLGTVELEELILRQLAVVLGVELGNLVDGEGSVNVVVQGVVHTAQLGQTAGGDDLVIERQTLDGSALSLDIARMSSQDGLYPVGLAGKSVLAEYLGHTRPGSHRGVGREGHSLGHVGRKGALQEAEGVVHTHLGQTHVAGVASLRRRLTSELERAERGALRLGYGLYLLTELVDLRGVLRVAAVEDGHAHGETEVHLALTVAKLHLLLGEVG